MTHEIDPSEDAPNHNELIERAVRINAQRVRLTPQRMGFQTLVWAQKNGGRGSAIEANKQMLQQLYEVVGADVAATSENEIEVGDTARKERVTPVALTEETTVYIREVQSIREDGWQGAKLTCSIRGPER